MEGGQPSAATSAPPVGREDGVHQRELSTAGTFLSRLLGVATASALIMLTLVGSRASAAGEDLEMTGMTVPLLLVGLFWLGTFAAAVWMVRVEWSGGCLAAVVAALGVAGFALGRAVPLDSPFTHFTFGVGELALELRFSLLCASVAFVTWGVWASTPEARRSVQRPLVAGLGVAVFLLLLAAWGAQPDHLRSWID